MSKAWSLAEGGKDAPCQGCSRKVAGEKAGSQVPCKAGCKRADKRQYKVALVFWDGEGRAITEDRNHLDSLPGSFLDQDGRVKTAPILVENVEHEIKWVTKYSRLHTIASVQKYFDKIPDCGTLILLCPLPSSKEVIS